VLVAHSLGVLAVVQAMARRNSVRPAGAFLVVPPSPAWVLKQPDIDPAFAQVSDVAMPCPTMLVASRNDLSAAFEQSADMAENWGAQLVDAGEAGHLNTESGHGPWPEGALRFARFIASLKA
jgi:predicted alpha/beta hydrolase family esterase